MISRFHAINRFASVVFVIALTLLLGACAETEIPFAEDATTDTSTVPDVGNDTSPPDVTPDSPDTTDKPEPDTRCTVCCPDDVRCSSTGVREICNAEGTAYVENACSDTQQCDGGACVDKPICTPGETSCYDTKTLLICSENGMRRSTETCNANEACINGACVSGHINGTQCTADADCAGEKCRCGSNDNCPSSWKPTYCTNACTRSTDCASNEWCLSADLSSAPHNTNHCVTRCDQTCAIAGLGCAHIPVHQEDGSIAWEQGCVQNKLKSIGDKCTADADCISGTCLEYFADFKFCSNRCENTGCSENSACVPLIGQEYWCSVKCTGLPDTVKTCPFAQPGSDWGIGCKREIIYGSANEAVRTCTKTN